MKKEIEPHCSFCGKAQHEVKKIIAGTDANICNECIELCEDLMIDDTDESVGGETDEATEESWANRELPTPKKNP